MNRIIIIVLLLLVTLASCTEEQPAETEVVETVETPLPVASAPDTFCFLRTGGDNNVDSAFIKIIKQNDSILHGDMRYLPKEKDSRIGVLLPGKMHGDTISLEWNCIQEGMKFSVPVSFIFRHGNIYQQLWAYNDKGEEYLPDTASYGLMYKPLMCSLYPVKVY